jgi:membrane-bound serine protease (ClpP class)
MTPAKRSRVATAWLLSISCVFVAFPLALQTGGDAAPVVYSAEVESIIHPVSAEYMIATINEADAAGASLIVFTLRTPGGLVDSTRDIVSRILSAKTPVAVLIAPAGARAASAGFILILAADVAAMAPGTHIGAAHPVAGGGAEMDETMAKKAASDVAAYVRTIASGRQRNVELSEEAVQESRAFTEKEALDASPPLIDLLASDVSDLLRQLDGRSVTRFDGSTTVLRTANATVVAKTMSFRQRILSSIANPNVAYLLLSLGMLGLTIELWNPGGIVPGVVGGVSLLLAFFALQVLPVNYAGVLLIALGILLLVMELMVTSFGLLTAGGVISLIFGSLILVDSPVPEMQLDFGFVLPIMASLVGITMFLVHLAVKAQRQPSVTGDTGMIGEIGQALSAIGPGTTGRVATHGEIWQATANEPIAAGDRVAVTRVDGLTLTVRRE